MSARAAGAALLLLAAAVCGAGALELVQLSSSNFEHETQAATGQTTGRWCVLFVEQAAAGAEGAEAAWDTLAAEVEEMEVERQAVFAKVDVSTNPELARRFAISQHPAAILFRDRTMYRLPAPLPADEDEARHLAMDFLAGGWESVDPEDVPPEAARRTAAGGASTPGTAAPAGATGDAAAAALEAAAAAARRLAAALGETDAVLRATGWAAAAVGLVILTLASYLGVHLNFNAAEPRTQAAPATAPAAAPAATATADGGSAKADGKAGGKGPGKDGSGAAKERAD